MKSPVMIDRENKNLIASKLPHQFLNCIVTIALIFSSSLYAEGAQTNAAKSVYVFLWDLF